MQQSLELGYLGVEVADREALGRFLAEVVGLVPGRPTPAGDATWRNDGKAQRIVVAEGPRDDATHVGFTVRGAHCNARHHSLALARAPFALPQALHHVMVEANDRDDVGRAFDRAWEAGVPISNGLGRHDNDGMFSFYAATPAGFQVEFGHGARVVDDGWDGNRRYDRISAWGHQPLTRG